MMNKYELFGLTENCTDEEFEQAYKNIRAGLAEDRFLEGEAGNIAAKKLTELDAAYREIKSERMEQRTNPQDAENLYNKIEGLIKAGNLTDAQRELDLFNERTAEWHYLQAVVFYKKNWNNESKKQLEIAIQMDPNNQKYKNSYNKLDEKIKNDSNRTFTSYTTGGNQSQPQYDEPRQMGGDGCCQWCCQMAACNMCLNCFCNSCG